MSRTTRRRGTLPWLLKAAMKHRPTVGRMLDFLIYLGFEMWIDSEGRVARHKKSGCVFLLRKDRRSRRIRPLDTFSFHHHLTVRGLIPDIGLEHFIGSFGFGKDGSQLLALMEPNRERKVLGPPPTYADLARLLKSLSFRSRSLNDQHRGYYHDPSKCLIVLPKKESKKPAREIHMRSTRFQLHWWSLMEEDDFDWHFAGCGYRRFKSGNET